eukprot:RCo026964
MMMMQPMFQPQSGCLQQQWVSTGALSPREEKRHHTRSHSQPLAPRQTLFSRLLGRRPSAQLSAAPCGCGCAPGAPSPFGSFVTPPLACPVSLPAQVCAPAPPPPTRWVPSPPPPTMGLPQHFPSSPQLHPQSQPQLFPGSYSDPHSSFSMVGGYQGSGMTMTTTTSSSSPAPQMAPEFGAPWGEGSTRPRVLSLPVAPLAPPATVSWPQPGIAPSPTTAAVAAPPPPPPLPPSQALAWAASAAVERTTRAFSAPSGNVSYSSAVAAPSRDR